MYHLSKLNIIGNLGGQGTSTLVDALELKKLIRKFFREKEDCKEPKLKGSPERMGYGSW